MTDNISHFLRRSIPLVVDLWSKRVLREMAPSRTQSRLALQNLLPEYLSKIADALSTNIERTPLRIQTDKDDNMRVSKARGHERASFLGYSIENVVFEYRVLRQVIFEVLEKEGAISRIDRDAIINSIEQAINDSASQFSDTLNDIQELFMLTLTHDLRGPITSAKLSAELILRNPERVDTNRKAVTRIIENMDRVDSMIDDLLDSSKLRAGQKLSMDFKENCDLESVLREVTDDMRFTHGDRFVISSRLPIVGHFSPKGFRRVFENLLTNAVKYGTPDSPIEITFEIEDSRVKIRIHNEGAAIPEPEQVTLFHKFKRSNSVRGIKGWGIGLMLVKGIVEAHGGTVRVESEPNKGTTFIIELPMSYDAVKPVIKVDVSPSFKASLH